MFRRVAARGGCAGQLNLLLILAADAWSVSSALSVLNFLFCLVIIAIYLAVVQPTKEVA